MIAHSSDSVSQSIKTITAIQSKLQSLSPEQQQQVLDFVEFLAQKTQPKEPKKTIRDVIDERVEKIPAEEWEKMLTDGSYQHDHCLYGTLKLEFSLP